MIKRIAVVHLRVTPAWTNLRGRLNCQTWSFQGNRTREMKNLLIEGRPVHLGEVLWRVGKGKGDKIVGILSQPIVCSEGARPATTPRRLSPIPAVRWIPGSRGPFCQWICDSKSLRGVIGLELLRTSAEAFFRTHTHYIYLYLYIFSMSVHG